MLRSSKEKVNMDCGGMLFDVMINVCDYERN